MLSLKRKVQLQLSAEIVVTGFPNNAEEAKKALAPVLQPKLKARLTDAQACLCIQELIDQQKISATIIYKGHRVWSRRRILRNLNRIAALRTVKNYKAVLSSYFYLFIISVCGSDPHHDRKGWLEAYPTFDAFKGFFLKNEHDKAVVDYVPDWKGDAKCIIVDIERKLFPFKSYLRSKRKPK